MIALAEIERARDRIAGAAVRTPLVRLPDTEIWLKLENLQPIGSFKIRGATNAIRAASPEELAGGVVTASAGNMAQGVAWAAREAGVPATIVVPDHAPQTKVDAIERLGGRVIAVPFERWWQTIVESRFEGVEGRFVHPVEDELVMAGNGTIGLELVEDLPDVDTVLVPFGGGGLSTGIASAVKALRPTARVYGVDPETGPALSSAFSNGSPAAVEHAPSFVDGSGSRGVLDSMWPYLSDALDGACVASLEETAGAVRLLAERVRVIAEGAGALALAVALSGRAGGGRIACIVSGGNIDTAVLTRILSGETPGRIRTMLEIGDRFPVEKLPVTPEGPAVVFFYPAALTPGCTMEAKGFNDRYQRFRDAGYEVVGVSVDDAEKNDEFRSECGLDFPLVSDTDTTLTTTLDLLKDYGEYGTLARRVTYLIDGDGIVQQVWDVEDAAAHPQEVLAAVEA